LRQHRRQQRGRDAQGFGGRVEGGFQPLARRVVRLPPEFPGGHPHDELVHRRDQRPHGFQALRKLELLEGVLHRPDGIARQRRDIRVPASGIAPPQYWPIMVSVRLARLPSPLARSEL